VFDRVTVDASSLEVLPLTVQQIPSPDARDRFLKAVYDWNLLGAVECIDRDNAPGERGRYVSDAVRVPILSAIAEKRFDRIENTRRRAEAQLREREHLPRIRGLLDAASRNALVALVKATVVSEGWFAQWREFFSIPDGVAAENEVIAAVSSPDSLVGWCASNTIRRLALTAIDYETLRHKYNQAIGDEAAKVVRWRIVHALGAHPEPLNIELLGGALRGDSYEWVRYGAARSLMEAAALSEGALRESALRHVREFLEGLGSAPTRTRSRLIREIVAAAFVRHARGSWQADASSVVIYARQIAPESLRSTLDSQLNSFLNDTTWH